MVSVLWQYRNFFYICMGIWYMWKREILVLVDYLYRPMKNIGIGGIGRIRIMGIGNQFPKNWYRFSNIGQTHIGLTLLESKKLRLTAPTYRQTNHILKAPCPSLIKYVFWWCWGSSQYILSFYTLDLLNNRNMED